MDPFHSIPTYVINLKKRIDRKSSIISEFSCRDEFLVNIVEACEHEIGAMGLWNTIVKILENLPNDEVEYILVCEDDHRFTSEYNKEYLFKCIDDARNKDADILAGGVSWFNNVIQVSNNLYWTENFTGLQFTIIFKKFFACIMKASFLINDAADLKISSLSNSKMFIYPFISTQKEFGYSDVTKKNEDYDRVNQLFINSADKIRSINEVIDHYNSLKFITKQINLSDYVNVRIPTYVISMPGNIDRLKHIKSQFDGKNEFEITMVPFTLDDPNEKGLWGIIKSIIYEATEKDDDVIIICQDSHQFTTSYSRAFLLGNIIEADQHDVDILSGCVGYFSQVIPLTKDLFWIDSLGSIQFIILYKRSFNLILLEEIEVGTRADSLLSEIASSKMVIFPFISDRNEFAHSDNNQIDKLLEMPGVFEKSAEKIENIIHIINKYGFPVK